MHHKWTGFKVYLNFKSLNIKITLKTSSSPPYLKLSLIKECRLEETGPSYFTESVAAYKCTIILGLRINPRP